jgi:hypothetical protein
MTDRLGGGVGGPGVEQSVSQAFCSTMMRSTPGRSGEQLVGKTLGLQ